MSGLFSIKPTSFPLEVMSLRSSLLWLFINYILWKYLLEPFTYLFWWLSKFFEGKNEQERMKTLKNVWYWQFYSTKVATSNTNDRISFEYVILSSAAFVTNYGSLTLFTCDDLFQCKCSTCIQIVCPPAPCMSVTRMLLIRMSSLSNAKSH